MVSLATPRVHNLNHKPPLAQSRDSCKTV